jgi:hypothetical protein
VPGADRTIAGSGPPTRDRLARPSAAQPRHPESTHVAWLFPKHCSPGEIAGRVGPSGARSFQLRAGEPPSVCAADAASCCEAQTAHFDALWLNQYTVTPKEHVISST